MPAKLPAKVTRFPDKLMPRRRIARMSIYKLFSWIRLANHEAAFVSDEKFIFIRQKQGLSAN